MFIRQGLNPYTRQPLDLFDWPTLEPFVGPVGPGVALTASTAQRVSRMGGAPEFVDEWPQGDSGPIPFLCHVDLAELAAQAGSLWPKRFPSSGVLSLFYDEAAALQSARSQSRPFALIADPDTRRRRARGEPCATSYPEVALEVARVTRPTAPLHQVGGVPQWIQSPDAAAGHFLSGAYLHYPDVVAALHDAELDERCFCSAMMQSSRPDAGWTPPVWNRHGLEPGCATGAWSFRSPLSPPSA
jgi:hypothetical protein